MALTSFGPALLVLLTIGFGTINAETTPAQNPCKPNNPCPQGTYCQQLPETEDNPYKCIENGHLYGNCSLNTVETCAPDTTCHDAPDKKSYHCVCDNPEAQGNGVRKDKGGTGCVLPVKECKEDKECPQYGYCDAGASHCRCNPGFQGDGFNCTDIIDCPSPTCDPNAICDDIPGNFTCTCDGRRRYQGNGTYCQHVCLSDNDCDPPRGRCNDVKKCECRPGFEGNGTHCIDIDECAKSNLNDCPSGADCINKQGGFECKCKNGFIGDGRNCDVLPTSCKEIPDFVNGHVYNIDPDGVGPAGYFEVECDRMYGEIVTKVNSKNSQPLKAEKGADITIDYQNEPEDFQPLLEKSGFCYQQLLISCTKHFSLFPGTKWYDAYGNVHENWATDEFHKCPCGIVGTCNNGCGCNKDNEDNKWNVIDSGTIVDKGTLPVVRFTFSQQMKGSITLGPLVCMETTAALPKNCHDAKFNHKILKNGPLYIDVDGAGPLAPILVNCDMTAYKHVGITEIPPNSSKFNIKTIEGEVVNYRIPGDEIKALINGSAYCSQSVEFECLHSRLMGNDGGYVTVGSDKRRLDYFPGANGVQDKCGCGATMSCDKPEVTCNCNIDDDTVRKDFGLIINKEDLPVLGLNGQYGPDITSQYIVGPMKCAGEQFGFKANCENYRAGGTTEDYSYFIDPDGPGPDGPLEPFLVECQFVKNPPQGKTIIHHEKEIAIDLTGSIFDLQYLDVTPDQIDGLKKRSSYCSQEVKVNCNSLKLQETEDIIQWQAANKTDYMSLLPFLDTCSDGDGCNCNGNVVTIDKGELMDMGFIPVDKIDMSKLQSQINAGASGSVTVGPLICAEVFPTCAKLNKFNKDMGEVLESGKYTIDPDGAGGVLPFEVKCSGSTTQVDITGDGETPDPNDPNSPKDQCFDIDYKDSNGTAITPAQMDALAKASGNCFQELSLECMNAPATGKVNFTTCDGVTQTGWAGSVGKEGCACGLTGVCAGGRNEKCNCDKGDDQLRGDSGVIYDNDRVPVCQVCLSTPVQEGTPDPNTSPPMQRFKLKSLVCDGSTGLGKSCQSVRMSPKTALSTGEVVERPSVLNVAGVNIPVSCKLYDGPPIGAMIVNPKEPLYPPKDPDSQVNVTIDYITINMAITRKAMSRNIWCRQKIFFFCVGGQPITIGGDYGFFDTDGNAYADWERMPAASKDVENACNQYKDLCTKCGKPIAYVIKQKKELPVGSIYLGIKGVTVVVDHVECMNMLTSCQELMDRKQLWYARTTLWGNEFLLDPDGAGEVFPFVAKCIFNAGEKVGTTEIPMKGEWVGKRNVKGQTLPGQFEIPVEFDDVSPEQARALAKISDFCWQNIEYECKYSPLLNNGNNPASYYYLNSTDPSSSFGTDDKVDATGCACGILGTCVKPDVTCNCDAKGPMGVDQGAITDKNVLPIVQVNVGGQTAQSDVNVAVSPMQCGKLPITPPRDCEQGRTFKNSMPIIEYKASGEFLISPAPRATKPFMVYCDYEILPGKAVTVIKPNYPPNNTVDNPDTPEDVPYLGPDDDQIKAIVQFSKYCYQGVKINCQASEVFKGGSYWLPASSTSKQYFWGGGDPASRVCACGKTNHCGGADSYTAQKSRKCNCDVGDDFPRSDAGIITQKEFLPVSKFIFGPNSKWDKLDITIGDLICSQYPIPMNECDLGYHDCHPMAKCVDTDDGYQCVCQKGWEGLTSVAKNNPPRANGRECIDDDECSLKECDQFTTTCTNTPGSFYCTCKPGFRKLTETKCVDIDECAENTHDCHENARCENIDASYRCFCNKGYKGDGKNCRAVGECKCFGDPHCLSFDSRWLHYQGLCEYIMSKDNCESGGKPTYEVWAKYWRRGSKKPGYYSYVESVRVMLGDLEIKLVQNRGIRINGIQMDQYTNPDGVSVIAYNREVVVRAPNGLEVTWDGKDAVTVIVPEDRKEDTCGICGNYNADPTDDWTVGEACEAKEGTVTDNFELFGNSWTVMNNSEVQCTPDCDPEEPPDPRDCALKDLIEHECSNLLDKQNSPFKKCLELMGDFDIEQFKMSCSYDLCFVDYDFKGAVCDFAETINKECTEKYKTRITTWREDVDSCEPGECANNMKYKNCGPVTQETCMTQRVNIPVEDNPNECYEGCFCESGLVMEGDKCIPKDDCGCLYNNQYIKKGVTVVNADCKTMVTCNGNDDIKTSPVNCGEFEECEVSDEGKPNCYCINGYMLDKPSGKCVVDPCYNVTCSDPNTACVKGDCVCKMGYIGNCNSCMNVDECAVGSSDCNKIGQKCTDQPGTYLCECEPGFVPDKGGNCNDVDECKIFADKCGANSECTNTLGGYSCECCAGYRKNDKGECIRDPSLSKQGQCCACKGEKCTEPGKVCGKDGVTYNDYRSLAVISCRNGKEVKVDYPGACQGSCETVKCAIPYQTCKPDAAGRPTCGCPTCEDSSSETVSETICASNKVTYTSICHMKAATCEAELEVQVEIESVGKPCGTGKPAGVPGPWTDFGPCSEPCKQGVMNRTRSIPPGSSYSDTETAPCFSVCEEGPCKVSTCDKPGQVCTVDINDVPTCKCPVCGDYPEQPVCGRIGTVIQTFDNPCEMQAQACAAEEKDYEMLEPRACEDKPKICSKVRQYKYVVDDNGCKADRSINVGHCYGGCDEQGEKCCFAIKKSEVQLIMSCPDSTFHRRTEKVISECKCIDNAEADELRKQENPIMNIVP